MKALRVTALIASVLCLAVLVSPAVASGPITSTTAAPAAEGAFVTAMGIGVAPASASDPFAIGQTLYIGVQSTADSAGLQNAADEMLFRLGAAARSRPREGNASCGCQRAHQRRGARGGDWQEGRLDPLDLLIAATDDGLLPAEQRLDRPGHGDLRVRSLAEPLARNCINIRLTA